jgi:TRAP-type mannitol/chloroaromatic compound transport system permease small subunit
MKAMTSNGFLSRALQAARVIDRLSETVGRGVIWLSLLMVLVGSLNTVGRYAGRQFGTEITSNAYLELQWYLFSLLFLLGAGYTLKHDRHVRVDAIYARLSERTRAWIDLAGTIAFLIPFCVLGLVVSWPTVRNSWAVLERSPDPGGLPRYPIKTMILVSFLLLLLQALAELVRKIAVLRGLASLGEAAPHRGKIL